jgi:hypothetical protein
MALAGLQDVKTAKATYDDVNSTLEERAIAQSDHTAAVISTVIRATAGLVTLGATGAFVAVKGISTDGQGLVFSGTW